MVYTVTDGKTKTPLHVMTVQSVYFRCRNCSTITKLVYPLDMVMCEEVDLC